LFLKGLILRMFLSTSLLIEIPSISLKLTSEERKLMEVVVNGRSGFGETDLEVVILLERILFIPLGISMMSKEWYNLHLSLTRQITFNGRNFLVFLFSLVLWLLFLTLVFGRRLWYTSILKGIKWSRGTM